MIGEEDIRKVREATDIVELIGERVVLKPRGREFWGNCPFHSEKTPSFKVDPASQFYHCFGCGEGGDAFKFVMKMENIEFLDAVRTLAQRRNIELVEEWGEVTRGRKARLLAVCEETADFYHQQLMRIKSGESDEAREYLGTRAMGGEIPRAWRLGFAPGLGKLVKHLQQKGFTRDEMIGANVAYIPERGSGGGSGGGGSGIGGGVAAGGDSGSGAAAGNRDSGSGMSGVLRDRFFNRIIFPINDLQGRIIAFGGRIINAGEPKYLNSADTMLFHKRDNLYAIDKAKAQITAAGFAIAVEGYTDVIAMHETGFTNTVATLGTALTPEHLKLLARFTERVVLLFDGDDAGLRAADRAAELINAIASSASGRKADVFVATLPGRMDPADFCKSHGRTAMQEVLDGAVPLLRFALDRRLGTWDLSRPEQRTRALEDVVRLLVPLKGSLLAADYSNYLADLFAVEFQVISSALEKAKPLVSPRISGSMTEADPTAQRPLQSPVEKSRDRISALECELLFLFIEKSEVRERLSEAFGRIIWSIPEHKAIATALLALDPNDEAEDMLAKLTSRMPEASSVLSGTRLSGFGGMPPSRLAGTLMFRIREAQLKQEILYDNARLHRLDKDQQTGEWDELFCHIAKLQTELSDLRRRYQSE